MIKRLFALLVAFALFGITSSAQKDSKFYVALQGGGAFSVFENCSGYFEQGHGWNLVKGQGALTLGYFFTKRYGIRLQGELSGNAGAGNYKDTNIHRWNPYTFHSFLGFADFVVNGGDVSVPKAFNWRVFAGVGVAYAYNFDPNPLHYYYEGSSGPEFKTPTYFKNTTTFAFRFGFNLEYIFRSGVGILFEACHEWMTDNYNGISPYKDGKHEGFPFDTKIDFSLGVAYHF